MRCPKAELYAKSGHLVGKFDVEINEEGATGVFFNAPRSISVGDTLTLVIPEKGQVEIVVAKHSVSSSGFSGVGFDMNLPWQPTVAGKPAE